MTLYPPPQQRELEVWSPMPEEFRRDSAETIWGMANKPGIALSSFLEGPAFDLEGNLYVTDIPYGRMFKISPDKNWSLVAEYDGWPNGLKIHRDGSLYITDYRNGVLVMDPATGDFQRYISHVNSEGLKGVNDLYFDRDGRIYFTDQGQSGMHDPTGRVFRFDPETQHLDRLLGNAPSPNGLVLDAAQQVLFVALTRGNAIWRMPVPHDATVSKVGIFTQLAGGVSGADGLAMDTGNNLYVCDAGNGCVWVFDKWAEPLIRYLSPTGGRTTTNIAFQPGTNIFFVTESETATILRGEADVEGQALFSHM